MGDIVRKQGRNIYTEGRRKELIAFLEQQNIARFKLPERLEVVPEFPLSPVGKILKRQLRERARELAPQEHKP